MTVTIIEEERQLLLLALAHLSVERPGWHGALSDLAAKYSTAPTIDDGRELFERFRALRGPTDLALVASAMKKVLPAPLLAEVLAHLDPLTPFLAVLAAAP